MPAHAPPIPMSQNSSRRSSSSSDGIVSQDVYLRRLRQTNLTAEQERDRLGQLVIDRLTLPQHHNNTTSSGTSRQLSNDVTGEETDEEEITHSSRLPKSGLRGFFRKHLPMSLLNSRIAKYFSKLQLRPKVNTSKGYRSSGDFEIQSIEASQAQQISQSFGDMANEYQTNLTNLGIFGNVNENLTQAVNINHHIENVANIFSQANNETESASFYMLKKKKDADPFAIAAITYGDGKMNIRGIAIHPLAMLARLNDQERNSVKTSLGITIGKYDVTGLGTALSLLASITTSRENKTIHSVVTTAVNPFSAKIFNKNAGVKNRTPT